MALTPLLHLFLHAVYDYCPIPGKSNVLFVVLHASFPPADPADYTSPLDRDPAIILPRAETWVYPSFSLAQRQFVYGRLQNITRDLLHRFFIPMQAAGGHTPSVSPLISARSRGDPKYGLPACRPLSDLPCT